LSTFNSSPFARKVLLSSHQCWRTCQRRTSQGILCTSFQDIFKFELIKCIEHTRLLDKSLLQDRIDLTRCLQWRVFHYATGLHQPFFKNIFVLHFIVTSTSNGLPPSVSLASFYLHRNMIFFLFLFKNGLADKRIDQNVLLSHVFSEAVTGILRSLVQIRLGGLLLSKTPQKFENQTSFGYHQFYRPFWHTKSSNVNRTVSWVWRLRPLGHPDMPKSWFTKKHYTRETDVVRVDDPW